MFEQLHLSSLPDYFASLSHSFIRSSSLLYLALSHPLFFSLSLSSSVPLFTGLSHIRRSLVPPSGSRSLSLHTSSYISPSLKATLFPSREIAASLSSPRGPILSFLSALSPFHLERAFEFSLSRSRPDTPRTCPLLGICSQLRAAYSAYISLLPLYPGLSLLCNFYLPRPRNVYIDLLFILLCSCYMSDILEDEREAIGDERADG